jgi:thiamine pyrophosphate-dependent acetolactate synthase large subunit-like protein
MPILADVGSAAAMIAAALPETLHCLDLRDEVAERKAIWRTEKARRLAEERGRGVPAAALFAALTDCVPDDAVICVDVGNNTYSFGRYFEASGQSVLMSGYLGSIGFAFPAAIGAWAAVGDRRPVISISGDGGFGQYAMELTTAVKYGMDITHVLLDNSELGKISKEQRSARYDVWQTSLHNPDFASFAESCGALGIRVSEAAMLETAIADALAHRGPALVVVSTDPMLM